MPCVWCNGNGHVMADSTSDCEGYNSSTMVKCRKCDNGYVERCESCRGSKVEVYYRAGDSTSLPKDAKQVPIVLPGQTDWTLVDDQQ